MKQPSKSLLKSICTLGVLLQLGAQAAPDILSISNTTTIPTTDQVRCPSRAGGQTSMPDVSAVLQPQLSEALLQLETRLKEMKPTDPGYTLLVGMRDQLIAQQNIQSPFQAPIEPETLAGSERPVNLTEALGMLQAALEGSLAPETFATLKATSDYQSASKLRGKVPIAMANGKPLAAMAFLLRAHELDPNHPEDLVSLSGLANFYGFWYESLALLEAARAQQSTLNTPWGMNPTAMILNNQGHALLGLNRPAQAEVVLREAVRLEPLLTEAKKNLAQALGEQGKCTEAARWYRLGNYRMPLKDMVGPGGGPVESPEVDVITLKPYEEAYAMSKGIEGRFPNIPMPANIREATEAAPFVSNEMNRAALAAQQNSQKFQQLWPGIYNKGNQLLKNPKTRMTGEVTLHLMGPINSADPEDADINKLYEKVDEAHQQYFAAREPVDQRYIKAAEQSATQYSSELLGCNGNGPCQERARIEHDKRMCAAGKQWNSALLGDLQQYDMAYRAYYRPFHKVLSGLVGYLSDAEFYQAATTQMKAIYFQNYSTYLSVVGMHVVTAGAYGTFCKDEVPPPDLVAQDPEDAKACEASPIKPKASVAFLEVTYMCEKVEVEASTEGVLAAFVVVGYEQSQRYVKLTDPKERFIEKQAGRNPDRKLQLRNYGYAFDGKLTIFAGGKVSAGGSVGPVEADVGAKFGPYVTIDGGGNILDAGGKVDTSQSTMVNLGLVSVGYEAEGPGDSFSIMSGK